MFNFNKNKAFTLTSKKPKGNNPLKKGFTLIEFIIVMAIIGILVLLASPKFLDYVDKAKLTQIKNDIKVVENITISYLADNDFNTNTLEEIDIKEGLSLTSNSLNDTIVLEGKTFDITKFVDSKLKGQFVINEDYEVIYIDDQTINKEPENNYDEFLATDEDFEFIKDGAAYAYNTNEGKGYYRYIGKEEVVKIPKEIKGTNITSAYHMFEKNNLTNLKVIDNGQLTNTSFMFYNSTNLENLDLSNFNTNNVTKMDSMFDGCSNLRSLNLFNLNTEKVNDMSDMFSGCSSLENLDLSSFNTKNVTDMIYIFKECSSLESLDLSSFDTKNVKYMLGMFEDCRSLESLDLSTFNTFNVTDMYSMFDGCSNLISLDLSNFNTSKVTDMKWMFRGCNNLQSGIARNQTEADKFNELLSKEIFKPKQ